jgi:hypothetical protein
MRARFREAPAVGPHWLGVVLGVVLAVWTMGTSMVVARQSSQTVDKGWRLTFTVSGGIAGLNRAFVLESSGNATVFDHGRRLEVRRQVSREELLDIERLIESVASVDMPSDGVCRDCLNYAIELQVLGRVVRVRADDITLSSSKAGPLVQALTRMRQRLTADR